MTDEAPLEGRPAGPKRSLILAGGGMRVAYQAGVMRALEEHGLVFDHVDGTSGGTINLAMLLSGVAPVEMCERWRTLKVKDFVSFLPLREYLRGTQVPALGDADGIVEHVFPSLGINVDRIRAARTPVGTFNVCNFNDKTNEAVPNDRVELNHLVAGISLPVFMPGVEHGGVTYVDSVWIRDANLMEAVRRGSEELWVVWCIGNTPTYHPGPFRHYVHMIELSANGALFEDLGRIADLNDLIGRGSSPYGQTSPIRVHVVKPPVELPLDPDFLAGRIDGETLVGLGYQDAKGYLETMTPEGVPLTSDSTKMRERGVGVTFTETLEGPFKLARPLPGASTAEGRFVFRANVDVDHLGRFVDDPEHTARMVGEVTLPGLDDALPTSRGRFNVLSDPEGDGKMALYEQGFELDGRAYLVSGRKELRDDPGFDMREDLTTMTLSLHEGTTTDAPVLGTGVVETRDGFRSVMTSVRVTNAPTVVGRAEAAATFARFFTGAVWDAYT